MEHRFRRIALAGAAVAGTAAAALVLAGPSANAEQCDSAAGAPNIVSRALGTACMEVGQAQPRHVPAAPVLAPSTNVASPPAEEEAAPPGPQVPDANPPGGPQNPTPGPEVSETTSPPDETESQPAMPEASTPPSVTETTGPPPPEVPASAPVEAGPETSEQPETGPTGQPQEGGPETGQPQRPQAPQEGPASQPALPVTGDHGTAVAAAGVGGAMLALGLTLVMVSRRRARQDG